MSPDAVTESACQHFQHNSAGPRQRIVRDLRHGVQERLTTLVLELQLAREIVSTGPPEADEFIARALDTARAALDQLRELTSTIHPPGLDLRGLSPSLAALAAQSPVPVVISRSPDVRLPPDVEADAYLFVVAALAHAVENMGATRADVSVDLGDHLEVTVRHDGGVDGVGLVPPELSNGFPDFGGTVRVTATASAETTLQAIISSETRPPRQTGPPPRSGEREGGDALRSTLPVGRVNRMADLGC